MIKTPTKLMKQLLLLVMLLGCSWQLHAQSLYTQDFSFSGNLTANGWIAHSGGGTNPIATTTGLTYTNHNGSGVGNAALISNLGGEDVNTTFTSQSGNGTVVYFSFLVNVTESTTSKTGDYFFHIGSPGGASWSAFAGRVFAKVVSGNVNFGVSNTSTGTYGTTNFSRNTVYLIVLKYTIVTGAGNDPVSMWVIPSGMPATEALGGTPEVVNTTTAGTDAINAIGLRQGSATTSPTVVVDAIRVGSTWASVVTANANVPTVTTDAVSTLTAISAQLNGTVNPNNSSTTVTFQYGLTNAYGSTLTATQSPLTGTSASAVSAPVTSLTPNNEYNYRVVGANTLGTTNGSNVSFVTLADVPAAPVVNSPTSASLTVAIATDANPAYSAYAIQETSSGLYVQLNGTLGATAVWQTASNWSSIVVGGLSPTTTYTFQVKARNSLNVETAFGSTTSGTTTVNTSPLIVITGTVAPFTTYAGTPSYSKYYTVSATFLTDPLVITAPSPFEVTLDTTTTWSSGFSIAPSSGTIADTKIYVRLNPSVAGTPSGSITHVATSANNPLVSVSGTSIDFEPSAQSVVSATDITNNSMTVQMSGGTGASRIVVASTSPVTYVPVDGIAPTGVNSNYSLAADQSGNRVVYNGTGTSFSLTGLSQTTQYYLASFEYNGSGVTKNYLSVNPGTTTATTYLNPPTLASTLVVKMKLDTFNLAFNGGNGARRLVVVSQGAAVSFTPAFGQSYSGVNSDFSLASDQGSNNRIVYDGTGNAVTVTGISRNTLYGIKVIEYNGSGSTSSYFISTGATTTLTSGDFQPYTTGTTYTQDFNSLPMTGLTSTSTTGFGQGPYFLIGPPVSAGSTRGWQFANLVTIGDVLYLTDNGSSTSGALYSYGLNATSNERALGFLASTGMIGTAGITFVNNSAVPLYAATVNFNGEQWRIGGSTAPNQLKFQYQLGTNSVLGGTWIDIPSLTYTNTMTGTSGPLDGNANFVAVNGTFNIPANWMPGQTLTLRIIDTDDSGTDHGLAVDDFSFSALPPAAPLQQDSAITFSSVLTTSMNVNWLNGDGANRIVVINTANTFTNPVNGTAYTANSSYAGSGEQVVYNGNGSSVNVSGLAAGTEYFVRVYAYNGAGVSLIYATQTATGNPASQFTASANPPTQLVVLTINNGNPVRTNIPFSITVQAQDDALNPQNVTSNTTVSLALLSGSGLLTGTTSGVILAGTNTVTISGLLYDFPEFGVQVSVDAPPAASLTGTVASIDVYEVASSIDFSAAPTNAVTGSPAATISVSAYRSDFSIDNYYTSTITLTKVSGPGTLSGTLTQAAVGGTANFNDIQFSSPGTYVLSATSGSMTTASTKTIVVTLPVVMNELAIPKYFGSKSTSSSNTNRTPVIACISFDNLLPGVTYNLAAGLAVTSEASTSMGAGSLWNGTSFATTGITNAITADVNGSSGPLWIAIQPSANATRFGAGEVHNLRVALSSVPFGTTINAQFISSGTLTALDIPTTAYDALSTNDGAFVTGKSDSCFSGRFALAYDNAAGSGQPLSVCGIDNAFYTNTSQSLLPGSVDSVYTNTALKGSFAFVVPIGANNPNGVRYVSIRTAANLLLNSVSDADGIWPSGANTTSLIRRQVVKLSESEVSMNTLTALAVTSTTNASCFGFADGSALASAVSLTPTIGYAWTPSGGNAAFASNLAAGTYVVTATDANGCLRTAAATITQPAQFAVTATNNGPTCIGTDIQLNATGGISWSWTGPNGFTSTDQNPLVPTDAFNDGGIYTVVATNASGCTNSASTNVTMVNCSCTPPVLTTTIVSSCAGGANGSIDMTITGGVAPYGILWSNGATTEDISGLSPGVYTVTVTDFIFCVAQQSFTVGNVSVPLITPSASTTICSGSSVTLTASAGNTYMWSTGETTASITVSAAGPYSVTVTTGTCVLTSAATTITVNTFGFTGNLYAENVGAPGGTTSLASFTGWQNGLPITYTSTSSLPVDIRNTNASNNTGSSGQGNVFFAASTSNPDRNLIVSGINTLGYTGIGLNFGLRREANGTDPFSVEYSTDGTSWTPLTITTPTNTTWTLVNAGGSLPASNNLRLRFSKNSTTNAFRLDDIKITGTTTTATIGNNTALTVCGSGSVYLSANTSTGLLWSNGATTKAILVNATGTYTYTATGANGCSSTSAPVTFTVNPEPTGSVSTGTIACNGGTTTVTVGASGGIGPYTGVGTFTEGAGTKSYIITDVTGCDDTVSVNISQPAVLNATATPGAISCNGGTTNITVAATGGTTPYTGTGIFTVSAGPYSFTVTDANGCTAVVSGNVSEPTLLQASSTTGSINCNGGTTSVIVSANGGTPGYTGTGTFTAFAGAYSYTVTDAKGCTAVTTGNISEPTLLIAAGTPGTIACNGGTTSVVVAASGGTSPYTGEGTFTASGGPYSYTVTDNNGCTAVASGTIAQPDVLVASAVEGTISCNGGSTTITVSATGGTLPYSGNGIFTVSAGPYTYTVTDANGCTSIASGNVTEPAVLALNSFSPSSGTSGSSVSISGTGMTVVTAVKFGTLTAAFTINSDFQITAVVPAGAVTATITLESLCGNVISSGTFTVTPSVATLNLKVLLQGYYAGGGQMTPALLNQGVSGAVATETDSITVELHQATSPFATAYSKTAILDLEGNTSLTFPAAVTGNSYYIVVLHRNHLQTWSKDPVTFGTTTGFDFSSYAAPRSSGQTSGGSTSTGTLQKQ